MSDEDFAVFRMLVNKPGMMYVTPDRQKVYLLDGQKQMFVFGGDFNNKTDAEVNQIICARMEHKH